MVIYGFINGFISLIVSQIHPVGALRGLSISMKLFIIKLSLPLSLSLSNEKDLGYQIFASSIYSGNHGEEFVLFVVLVLIVLCILVHFH